MLCPAHMEVSVIFGASEPDLPVGADARRAQRRQSRVHLSARVTLLSQGESGKRRFDGLPRTLLCEITTVQTKTLTHKYVYTHMYMGMDRAHMHESYAFTYGHVYVLGYIEHVHS